MKTTYNLTFYLSLHHWHLGMMQILPLSSEVYFSDTSFQKVQVLSFSLQHVLRHWQYAVKMLLRSLTLSRPRGSPLTSKIVWL